MNGMCSNFTYRFLCGLVRGLFWIFHPGTVVTGLEKLPEGKAVLCCNHSALTDPIWVVIGMNAKRQPRIMAKKELFSNRLFRWFFTKLGAFPVDRGTADLQAVKNAMQTLRDDNKLLIFPEGTRIRGAKRGEPHSGAILIASRMKAPIVPIYLSVKKGLFRSVKLSFGAPYFPAYKGAKPTQGEMEQLSGEMMDMIYQMGEQA